MWDNMCEEMDKGKAYVRKEGKHVRRKETEGSTWILAIL